MRPALCLVLAVLALPASAEDRRGSLMWQGIERTYLLHLPDAVGASPLPLVIALHGAGENGAGFAAETGFGAAAEAAGMLAVFPDGVQGAPGRGTWNAHFCCGKAVADNVDDVGFIGALIDAVAAQHAVDRNRIYATGSSNGGMFAYQLAVAHPWFAAVASVSGAIGGVARSGQGFLVNVPAAPLAVMIVHGRKDPLVLYDGGSSPSLNFPDHWKTSVADDVSFWTAADGCAAAPEVTEMAAGELQRAAYRDCRKGSEVVLWTIADGGHDWPSGVAFPAGNAAAEIIAFFARHERR
jgi:polyhydroxybutyrate depolymerase